MTLPRRTIPASGRCSRRASGRLAHRQRASLSIAADTDRSSAIRRRGSADITARLMGQWLSERLGQTVVIENRPGAGTNLAHRGGR